MSDDLVKRLRDTNGGWSSDEALAAADRIEELEAKLAKAVDVLNYWGNMIQNDAYDLGEMVSEFDAIVRTTLAELTGICHSCKELLSYPSGEGCAAMSKHKV